MALQPDHRGAIDKAPQPLFRRKPGRAFRCAFRTTDFRRVDPDQPDALATIEPDRVAIDDIDFRRFHIGLLENDNERRAKDDEDKNKTKAQPTAGLQKCRTAEIEPDGMPDCREGHPGACAALSPIFDPLATAGPNARMRSDIYAETNCRLRQSLRSLVMTTWFIRRAVEADSDRLAACIEAAYSVYADRGIALPAVADGIADDIRDNLVWVAVRDDAIIGGLILICRSDHAQLANVAVAPSATGLGIGRALMDQAEQEARRRDLRRLTLNTHNDIPENVRLYAHLGWRETGRANDTVVMVKDLVD